MIIQLCLDPLGNFNESEFVNIYTNADSFSNPLFENIAVSSMVFPNCPLNIEVPDGVSVVKIFDELNFNCVYIPVTGNLCTECTFDFDSVPTSNGPTISCGNLVSLSPDCVSSDWELHYRIEWINESSEVVFVSGYGSESFTFDYQHPLTGSNSVPVPPGSYTPILTHIWINWDDPNYENGIVYMGVDNYTGILPQNAPLYVMPINTCLSYYVDTFGFSCNNSYNPYFPYTHSLTFEGYSNSQPPFQTNFTFDLTDDIKYMAIEFRGNNEPETFKVILHAAAYSDPIILEWLTVGYGLDYCDIDYYSYPKKYKTNIFKKVTKLEHYTISDGDYLEMEVISESPFTQWTMRFKCITEDLNCDSCLFYPENHRKIFAQSIQTINGNYVCPGGDVIEDGALWVNYSMKSCDDFSGTTASNDNDFFKYFYSLFNSAQGNFISVNEDSGFQWQERIDSINNYNEITNYIQNPDYPMHHANPFTSIANTPYQGTCYSTESESLITYTKPANGDLVIHLQDETLFNLLVDSLNFIIDDMETYSTQDPTNSIEYYTYYSLVINYNTNGEDWGCGDGVSGNILNIHCTSEITWGDLDENTKFINITLPQITNQLPYDSDIDPCFLNWGIANTAIGQIQSSNNTVIDLTNNYSLCRVGLFNYKYRPYYSNGLSRYAASTTNITFKRILFHKSLLETIPINSSTLQEIPELSATTCENLLTILPQYYTENYPRASCDNAQYNDDFYGFNWTYFKAYYIGDEDLTSPMYEWAIKEEYTNQFVISGNSNTDEYTIINSNYIIQ